MRLKKIGRLPHQNSESDFAGTALAGSLCSPLATHHAAKMHARGEIRAGPRRPHHMCIRGLLHPDRPGLVSLGFDFARFDGSSGVAAPEGFYGSSETAAWPPDGS